ncbi:response regulator [Emticicia fontis]
MLFNKTSPVNILLAEDDEDDLFFFTDALTTILTNINLITVNDGKELIKTIEKPGDEVPDIIFLDLNMPRMNGIECLTRIRSKAHLQNVPCIIMTTTDSQEEVNKAFKAGANLFLIKPAEFDGLKKLIEKILTVDYRYFFPPNRNLFFFNEHSFLREKFQ